MTAAAGWVILQRMTGDPHAELRGAIERMCAPFDADYWRRLDEEGAFPEAFVQAFVEGGWMGTAMPVELGGSGLGLAEACVVMQTVAASGAGFSGASAVHLNIFGPMPIAKFGTDAQRREAIPRLISGQDRMCFGVTEPDSGLDTARLKTRAERSGNGWVINGRKIWTSGALRANKILLLARTSEGGKRPTDGLSLFYCDLDPDAVEVRPIPKMGRAAVESNSVFIDNLKVPAQALVGEECGAQANAAKYLAAEAGFAACETAVLTLGGMGYAKEYDVERYFREIMIARIAPVSREMILNHIAERVLGLPRSY